MPNPTNTPTPSPSPSPSPATTPTPKSSSPSAQSSDDAAWAAAFNEQHPDGLPPNNPNADLKPGDEVELPTDAPPPSPEEPTEPESQEPDAPTAEPEAEPAPEEPPPPASADALNDADKHAMKMMSRAAKEHFAKRVNGLTAQLTERDGQIVQLQKQVEINTGKRLPDSYHDHPEAYTLTPEWGEISKKFTTAQQATAFWNAQLDALDDGQPFKLIGTDGKPVEINPEQLNDGQKARYKRQLEDNRSEMVDAQKHWSAEGQKLADSHRATFTASETRKMDWLHEHAPYIKDEKHPAHQIYLNALDGLAKLSGFKTDNSDRKFAAASFAHAQMLHAELQKERANRAALVKAELDKRRAGPQPRGGVRSRNTTGDGDKKMTLDDFA